MEYEKYTVSDPLFDTSNVYRIGDTLVDTGSIPSSRGDHVPIEDVMDDATMDPIERVVVTHPHVDHIGGSETFRLLSSLPHVVYHGGQSVLKDFELYLDRSLADWRLIQRELPADNHLVDFEWPQEIVYFGKYVPVEQTVTHGETIWIDDATRKRWNRHAFLRTSGSASLSTRSDTNSFVQRPNVVERCEKRKYSCQLDSTETTMICPWRCWHDGHESYRHLV